VQSKVCEPPHNEYWDKQQYARIPVTHVDWFQANAYAKWVGGRLPTEAEWENACRGNDGNTFSWGNHLPSPLLANYIGSGLPLPSVVGSYPAGAHGLYDMSGNVWEWTSTLDRPYPYVADDGREDPTGTDARVLRGGAFNHDGDIDFGVSCTVRGRGGPLGLGGYYGFRVVVASDS
jgi:iron(II)-dependent oxidoreductase